MASASAGAGWAGTACSVLHRLLEWDLEVRYVFQWFLFIVIVMRNKSPSPRYRCAGRSSSLAACCCLRHGGLAEGSREAGRFFLSCDTSMVRPGGQDSQEVPMVANRAGSALKGAGRVKLQMSSLMCSRRQPLTSCRHVLHTRGPTYCFGP